MIHNERVSFSSEGEAGGISEQETNIKCALRHCPSVGGPCGLCAALPSSIRLCTSGFCVPDLVLACAAGRNYPFRAGLGKKREKGYLRWRLKHRAFSTCGSFTRPSGVALRSYSENRKAWDGCQETLRKGGVEPSVYPGAADLTGTDPSVCPQEGPCQALSSRVGAGPTQGTDVCVQVPGESSAQRPGRSTDSAWIKEHLCGLVLFSVPEQPSVPLHTGPALFKYSSSA